MDEKHIAEMLLTAERLKDLPRTGWILAGCELNGVESVASHAWGVTFATLLLSRHIIASGESVDLQRALEMATVHDIAESFLSDIPQRAESPEWSDLIESKTRLEKRVISDLVQKNQLPREVLCLWEEYHACDTMEARIVRAADILDMLVRAARVRQRGVAASLLQQFFDSGIDRLAELGVPLALKIANLLREDALKV